MSTGNNNKKPHLAQQRLLKVIMALAGHEVDGLAPSQLSKGLNVPAANITRDLRNLRLAGWAEKTELGRWKLSPKLVQIATAYSSNLQRSRRKLDEVENRYTRLSS